MAKKHQPASKSPPAPPSAAWRWLAVFCALTFLVLAGHAAWVETPTIDEFAHVPVGCLGWTQGRFDLYAKNPPLWRMAMATPVLLAGAETPSPRGDTSGWAAWLYGYDFLAANEVRYLRLFWLARLVSVAGTLLCGLILYLWTTRLLGDFAAAVTTSLFFLNPNVLAHGHLATTDMACAFTVLLTLFALSWTYRQPAWWRVVLLGLAWGAALLTKFTAVLLLPVLLGLIAWHRWPSWRRIAMDAAVLLSVACLAVNVGMGFKGSFARIDSFTMGSQFGQGLQRSLPAWLPVPLPRDYAEGFDQQKRDTERGEFGNYLFGVWSREGWWHYNLVAMAVKNPLSVVILLCVGPWWWRRVPISRRELWEAALPAVVLLASMVLFNRLNIGVRYLLPVFPLALLLAAPVWHGGRRWQPWLAGALLLLHVGTAAMIHPRYLSYFNLAVGGPSAGHGVLLDSNLDWGQDLYRLPEALAALGHQGPIGLLYFGHVPPGLYGLDYYLPPPTPAEGVFAISVQYYMGGSYAVTGPDGLMYQVSPEHIGWLRQFPPTSRAGTIWIFDTRGRVTPQRP
jgi:4-amino-4-deoxy-L-arabinose transferase-like glycosyltransferase